MKNNWDLERAFTATVAAGLLITAVAALFRPGFLVRRFVFPYGSNVADASRSITELVWWVGISAAIAGAVLTASAIYPCQALGVKGHALMAALLTAAYLSLTVPFRDWIIDDAAITFAYSENLVEGRGLVLFPGHPREEAYSNTLWMLALALFHKFGFDIPIAAKATCTTMGVVIVLSALHAARRLSNAAWSASSYFLFGTALLGSSFVIWSISGLETTIQSLILVVIVLAALTPNGGVWIVGISLTCMVLIRPEAPLMGIAVAVPYASRRFSERGLRGVGLLWPMAVLPLATLVALIAFRMYYFGDSLPNPYYAKASEATFLRIFNLVGGGWDYVLTWLGASGMFLAIPIVLVGLGPQVPFAVLVALSLMAGQLAFVLFAGGDWMGQWRFMAPLQPLFALCLGYAYSNRQSIWPHVTLRQLVAVVIGLLLSLCTVKQLALFRTNPTTPYLDVARIGTTFAEFGMLLGVDQPTLAHHDAGGTSYKSVIDLIDLGGLGNRTIAKHMDDTDFISHYLFAERKPTFIFGATEVFAAGRSRFYLVPAFNRDYVAVEFQGRPFMQSGLCHVRRDALREIPGIGIIRDSVGRIQKVVVDALPR